MTVSNILDCGLWPFLKTFLGDQPVCLTNYLVKYLNFLLVSRERLIIFCLEHLSTSLSDFHITILALTFKHDFSSSHKCSALGLSLQNSVTSSLLPQSTFNNSQHHTRHIRFPPIYAFLNTALCGFDIALCCHHNTSKRQQTQRRL